MKKEIAFSILLLSTGIAVAQTTEQPSLLPPVAPEVTQDDLLDITNSINNEIIQLGSKTQQTIDILQKQIADLDYKTQDSMDKMFDSLMYEIDGLQISTEEDTTVFYSEILEILTQLESKIAVLENNIAEMNLLTQLNLGTVQFETASSELSTDQLNVVTEIVNFLNNYPSYTVTLEGHADARGHQGYNYRLGEDRAAAVKTLLVNFGISEDRIKTVSLGQHRPASAGVNEESWKQNRRVVFVLNK